MDFCNASAKEKCIRLVCEKLTVFPYGQYISGIVVKYGFKSILCYEIEVGI